MFNQAQETTRCIQERQCLVFVDDVSVPIARSPVRDSRSKDYRQHCPGHLPSSVHVCCYWSPVV